MSVPATDALQYRDDVLGIAFELGQPVRPHVLDAECMSHTWIKVENTGRSQAFLI